MELGKANSKVEMVQFCSNLIANVTNAMHYQDQCDPHFLDQVIRTTVNETGIEPGDSVVLKFSHLQDNDLMRKMIILLGYYFAFRLVNFIVLVLKMKWKI